LEQYPADSAGGNLAAVVRQVERERFGNGDLIGITAAGLPCGPGVFAGEILGEGFFGSFNIVCNAARLC
jgi:hypothetical protein